MNLCSILILLYLLLIPPFISRSQECSEFVFYELILEEIRPSSMDSLAFSFDYGISDFIIKSIQSTALFDKSEQEHLIANMNMQSECITNHLSLKTLSANPPIPSASGYFIKKHYSLPITLSENKKVMLSNTSISNVKFDGGKAIGNEILFIFEKKKGKWSIIKKVAVATY